MYQRQQRHFNKYNKRILYTNKPFLNKSSRPFIVATHQFYAYCLWLKTFTINYKLLFFSKMYILCNSQT